ncbi:GNAT family N-acetyltransferase [Piscibacillus salipiscarius]|nr:GNAT family N-acetyltransferase [Piscibacillus salipiscarius]
MESPFNLLRITTPSNNTVTNAAIDGLCWKQTSQQLEMVYELNQYESSDHHLDVKPIEDQLIPDVATLFENVFNWHESQNQLKHYLNEFGMDAACIFEGEKLKGAILWDAVEETNFVRLEDVAVVPEARRQGIATKLIEHVIQDASSQSKEDIFLAVDLDHVNAIKLYEKIGFKRNMINVSYEIKS